jgi:hypothetical protein
MVAQCDEREGRQQKEEGEEKGDRVGLHKYESLEDSRTFFPFKI